MALGVYGGVTITALGVCGVCLQTDGGSYKPSIN